jgi:hypothetical protein
VTRWGYISLVGIVLSSILGVIAQLKESSKDEQEKSATAQQTLALAQKADKTLSKTDTAIHEIERTLSPLGTPKLGAEFAVDCREKMWIAWCNAKQQNLPMMSVTMDYFINTQGAQEFLDGHRENGNLHYEFIGGLPFKKQVATLTCFWWTKNRQKPRAMDN